MPDINDLKEAAIRMIREGRNNYEISKELGVSPQTIAAYKAHMTMGTYRPRTESEAEEIKEVEVAVDTTFGLERDLQSALRTNITQLDPELKIVDGGSERSLSLGRIDITAEDRNGSIVIIELKAGEADRDAIGQLLSYIGEMLDIEAKPVRGILVAGSFSPRALVTARAVPNVELVAYSFNFSFNSIGKSTR